jgi:copper oxidase (laccase) domain-containing protein
VKISTAGITTGGGESSPICARESADHYSYRREGTTGRFAGFAWFEEA